MDENNKQIAETELEEAIKPQLEKLRTQNMLLGFQVACHTILQKIIVLEKKPGKTTMNDYKRLVKDVKQFCTTGISRKVNLDGTTSHKEEETIQN